ncbi:MULTISPECIES: hypothetical protein [unclassified Endozoicomonas]|uniref:hypothetical protein n=1 Tax=unclassified Endozoicomonas TaxID=2644528 RepID=UPI003BB76FF6
MIFNAKDVFVEARRLCKKSSVKAISMPAKYAMGMALTSGSFFLIPLASLFASAKGLVASGLLVLIRLRRWGSF